MDYNFNEFIEAQNEILDLDERLTYKNSDVYQETIIKYGYSEIISISYIGDIHIFRSFFGTPKSLQKIFTDYFIENDSSKYVYKRKYNVVIGKDTDTNFVTAYKKVSPGEYIVDSQTERDSLTDEAYLFTQSELNNLRVRLSDEFVTIVNQGTKEVL